MLQKKLMIESAREAQQVHQWVSSMNIKHIVKKIDWVFRFSAAKS